MRNPSHQLAALVRHLLLPTLVVWLRQDSRDGEIARINLKHCPADRVKRAQPRGRGEGLLQHVESRLRGIRPSIRSLDCLKGHNDGLHLEQIRHALCRELMTEEAEPAARTRRTFGAFGVELQTAEDIEYFRDVEHLLLHRRQVHQAIVHINECTHCTPAQRARGPQNPSINGRGGLAGGAGPGAGPPSKSLPI